MSFCVRMVFVSLIIFFFFELEHNLLGYWRQKVEGEENFQKAF